VATAIWAFAIVIVTSGIVGTGNGVNDPVRIALIGIGSVMAAGYLVWARRRGGEPDADHLHVERRAVTIAVAVGLVIGFAQAGPLFQLTLFFQIVLRYGALGATLATAPFIVALVVAGPVAGMLLVRFSPRALISGGLAAVGMGNVVAALVLGPQAPYIAMALSFALIGTGFVITTTVRTAIIFASVPRGLPGTAAALNQASVQVGSRIGLVVLTVLTTRLALDAFGSSLGAVDPGQRDSAVAAFADVLKAIGTPAMGPISLTIAPNDLTAYSAAFTEALRQALVGTGLVTLIAAPIAWVMLGRRDPLTTVWEHSDERTGSASMFAG
jgi:MFS transporter, DHA2 family, multidrug resistance protein